MFVESLLYFISAIDMIIGLFVVCIFIFSPLIYRVIYTRKIGNNFGRNLFLLFHIIVFICNEKFGSFGIENPDSFLIKTFLIFSIAINSVIFLFLFFIERSKYYDNI